MKGLELERANHSATPCAVERRDESKGENRCGRGQTKHRWNDVNDDDNTDRPRMADDDTTDSQALTGGDITRSTEHSLHESATSYKTDHISSLRRRHPDRWRTIGGGIPHQNEIKNIRDEVEES